MRDSVICNQVYEKIGNVNNVLDIGCGEGYLVNCLAKKLNKKVIGFDISYDSFAKSYGKCKRFNTCSLIKCIRGDAHETRKHFQPESFDAITLIYTLHHIKRTLIALVQIRKILKDKGKIIVGDYWFTNRKKKQGCYRFTVKDIKRLLKRSGFRYLGEDRIDKNFVLITGEKDET